MNNNNALPFTMAAWLLHGPKDLRLERRDVPSAGPGEVLLRIGSVGICGSEKHFYTDGKASSDVLTEPVVLGHEFGGTIVAVGEGIDAARVGERVAVEPLIPKWDSREAREGRYNIDPDQRFFGVPGLDGALQEYLAVPAANAHFIPESVSDDAAAMVETISVALNGVQKGTVPMGGRALVAGGGPVGLFVVQLLRASGVVSVALVEPQESRRRMAVDLGAVGHSSLDDVGSDYDAFFECTGVGSVRHDGFFAVRPGGKVVFVGVGGDDASVPMSAVIEREITLHGVMRYAGTWPRVVDMIAKGTIDADRLVSRRLPFEEALSAWTAPIQDEVKTMIAVGS